MMNRILDYLDSLFPNPRCELNYNKDYELLIATVLSAQTTDKRVNLVTNVLFKKYDSLLKLSQANLHDVENIIKEIGTYHRKSIYVIEIAKILISDGYDYVPNNREYLESLPGVGHKTANVFLSNIYDEPAIAVDTHVSRVSKRLSLALINDDPLQVEKKLMKLVPRGKWSKTHQQLVLFGRYHCKAIRPECDNCLLKDICNKK